MRWESYHSSPPDRGAEGLNIVLMELGGLVLWNRTSLWNGKLQKAQCLGTWAVQELLIGRGFGLGKFPGAIIRHQFGPNGVCSTAKVRRHNSIFRLARWDTRKACEVSFKLHALQWLFDDVRP